MRESETNCANTTAYVKSDAEYTASENDPRLGRLHERLKVAIGERSTRAVADEAGISEGTVRNLLNGGIPKLDSLLRIADAAGVSASWLATGEGPMRPDGNKGINDGPGDYTVTLHQVTAALDKAQLASAIETVEEALTATRRTIAPTARADLIAATYDLFTSGESGLAAKELIMRLVKTTT